MIAELAAALVLAGAAAEEDPVVRDCRTRVESGRAPFTFRGPDDIVAGPVSLWLLRRAELGLGQRYPNGRYFVKTPVNVRAGRAVTVSVSLRHRDRIGLVRTTADDPAPVVRFEPCTPATRAFSYRGAVGPVTGFNAGFVVSRKGCYPLDVRVEGGRSYRVRIAFGYPCR